MSSQQFIWLKLNVCHIIYSLKFYSFIWLFTRPKQNDPP